MTPLALADKMAFLATRVWDDAWIETFYGVGVDWRMSRAMLYGNAGQSSPLDSDELAKTVFAYTGRHSI